VLGCVAEDGARLTQTYCQDGEHARALCNAGGVTYFQCTACPEVPGSAVLARALSPAACSIMGHRQQVLPVPTAHPRPSQQHERVPTVRRQHHCDIPAADKAVDLHALRAARSPAGAPQCLIDFGPDFGLAFSESLYKSICRGTQFRCMKKPSHNIAAQTFSAEGYVRTLGAPRGADAFVRDFVQEENKHRQRRLARCHG
jgi:hypothetical protein